MPTTNPVNPVKPATSTDADNKKAGWIIVIVIGVMLGIGAISGSGSSGSGSTTGGKPAIGTDACKNAQLAYAHTLPTRPLYDEAEFHALAQNLDDLCSQPDRITH